jgi:hypothetical protein
MRDFFCGIKFIVDVDADVGAVVVSIDDTLVVASRRV